MDISYIPRASQAGAKVYADCRADKLVVKNRRADGVEGVVLNRETRKPAYKFKINTKIVVVSGGAIMTPLLLLKNRLANGNGEVGKNLRLHPCSRVAGIFKEEVEAWKGVLQSFYIDSYRDEGIMFEATSLPLSGLALAMPYFGLKQKELMAQYRNLADVGYLISDTSSGRVRTGLGQEPFITYQINQTDHEKSVRAAAILSEILFAAGAEKVLSPIAGLSLIESPKDVKKIREMKIKKHYLDYMSFHPMGTCRMGKDPKKSVVNRELESHEVKGLFICDASILPTSTLVNPQMTIMAFATRLGFWLKENREQYL
jgi:choline dehydrogenase-like flavoprotein